MTENKQDRTLLIAVITGVIALLLGLCLGALAGGVGGYFVGRSAAPEPLDLPEQQFQPQITPSAPRIPQMPGPVLPEGAPQSGALVREVVSGAPADQAGLRLGDLITQVDQTPLDANHSLADVLGQYQPGDQVQLTVWRFDETRTIDVKLGQHPDSPRRAHLGIKYVDFSLEQQAPGD
ncbi:MAG: hypothetical protein CVU38_07905 [Chloroflexi bacterium HGW-Chloroflexi-1]|nr:MAG: hypothetical protein CVU38_07905 [Chloroflexi bacterium HGW-Chloroflexi-1]